MNDQKLNGNHFIKDSFLGNLEDRLINRAVKHIPSPIKTYHLTLSSLGWSLLAIVSGVMAHQSLSWVWGITIALLGHYLTDALDGAVGRYHHTGLVRWGFFMDHFCDFLFSCSILLAYSFIAPASFHLIIMLALITWVGHMVHFFLKSNITQTFQVSYLKISPTEVHLILIIFNTLTLILGIGFLQIGLTLFTFLSGLFLLSAVIHSHHQIWQLDMAAKDSTHD